MSAIKERYNIMVTPRVMTVIDTQARRLYKSRSELIQQILYEYIVKNNLLFNLEQEETVKEVV